MAARIKLPTVDPFLMWLVGCVVAASVLPARGVALAAFDTAADAAIVLLFFLHGAKLSREAVLAGIGHWRLHLMTLAFTYVLFPVLGLAAQAVTGRVIDPTLAMGLLFLALLPSTVQSSIAMTAMAGGNVAAAVCSASFSNLIGIVLTPALVALLMENAGAGISLASIEAIVFQLLVPFVAGHLLRPWIGAWVARQKKMLTLVDRGSILLVVYTAFGAAVVEGLWHHVSPGDLALILAACIALLATVLAATWGIGRAMGLSREDAIVLLFCGSKKSLASGVPMAGVLFPAAQVGVVLLPVMLFHQIQLIACALIAKRMSVDEVG